MITRKYSSKKNKVTVSDFGALKEILNTPTSKPEVLPSAQLNTNSARDAVIGLMSDFKGRSAEDIVRALESAEHAESSIRATVRLMDVRGYFNNTKGTGKVIHTLKVGACSNAKPARKVSRMFRLPEQAIIDPAGIISRFDDLDTAIWKATSDHKKRTANEIADILAEFGFERQIVRDRTVSLMMKKWFIRRELNKTAYYELRSEIKMPANKGSVEMPEPNTGRDELVTTFRPQEHKSAVVVEEHPAIQPTVTTKPLEPTSIPTPPLLATDTIRIMIWKVMSDYKEYTTPDIVLLLGDMAKTATSVASALSALDGEGWFDRKEIGRSPRYSYTLRRSIPMPTDMRRRKAEEKPAAQSEQTETQVTEKEITVHAVKNTPQPQAPLVEIAVKIKGQLFTSLEAKQLTSELSLLGYGHAAQRLEHPPKGLVTKTISIKGMEFTDAELEVLVSTLNATRFG